MHVLVALFVSFQSKLSQADIDTQIQVIQDDQRARRGEFMTDKRGLVPPLVTTDFITQDQGNASPRYVRSTMYTVPTTADIVKQVCHVRIDKIVLGLQFPVLSLTSSFADQCTLWTCGKSNGSYRRGRVRTADRGHGRYWTDTLCAL